MKKLKYQILFTILMMTIGIAAVTTNLSLGGSTELAGNTDDFDVYITDVKDVSSDASNNKIIINGKRSFSFVTVLSNVDAFMSFEVHLVNASKLYDAEIFYDCIYDSDYVYIGASLDTTIPARQETFEYFDIYLTKPYVGEDKDISITCEVIANAVERDEVGGDDPVGSPVVSSYNVGDEIAIGAEKFNIISQTDDTVSMLAQYGVNDRLIQDETNFVTPQFDGLGDWGTPSEYMDINIQNYDNEIKSYVNGYVDYISSLTGDSTISGDLISLKQIETLGCTISEGYLTNYNETCLTSPYKDWLINKWMWTKTARIGFDNTLWLMNQDGELSPLSKGDWCIYESNDSFETGCDDDLIYGYHSDDGNAVRPVLTISKATLAKYV